MQSTAVCLRGKYYVSGQEAPYLSIVATARNDNHGGNLLRRMQIFVDACINQCKRHNLAAELVIVEWNPPAEKPKLAEALRWPDDTGPCQVRIIEVPPEVHNRYRHAAALPLYQMIAKNVGIRRARGEFILVTNIDVVFSNELMAFIAARKLERGRIYRVDRTDVDQNVPVDGTLDEQLAHCRDHIIRLCARDGIFRLTPEGFRANEEKDITPQDSGVYFGAGWFEVELYTTERFRWIRDEAEIFLKVPEGGGILAMDLEPGPGVGPLPQRLVMLSDSGSTIAELRIMGRSVLRLSVPRPADGKPLRIRLCVPEGGRPVPNDPRIMNFRFFRCEWADPVAASEEVRSLPVTLLTERPTIARVAAAGMRSGASFVFGDGLWKAIRLLRLRGTDIFDAGAEYLIGEGWHHLERAPTETFRWVDDNAEIMLRFPDGTRAMGLIVQPGPTIGYRPFELEVRLKDGQVVSRARIDGVTYVQFPVPLSRERMTSVFLKLGKVEGGSERIDIPGDERNLNFRVFACGRAGASDVAAVSHTSGQWSWRVVSIRPVELDWPARLQDHKDEIEEMEKPLFLHLYACGDFQLMARTDWDEVRGYAELDQFSMHLDSLLSYCAHHLGIREEVLPAPMRIYHVEHDVGTGWTPEGYKELSARIARKGIQTITFQDLAAMVTQMRRWHAPMIWNLDDWGLAKVELPETQVVRSTAMSR